MTPRSASKLRHAHRRAHPAGTAMIETVLALPLLFLLFALIVYFGFSMMRWHRVATVDRYEAWRAVAYAPGPRANLQNAPLQLGQTTLAQHFFPTTTTGSGATQTVYDPYGLQNLFVSARADEDTLDLASAIALLSRNMPEAARAYFEALFLNPVLPLPTTRVVTVSGEFDDRVGQTFAGDITHRASRLDGDWRYVNDAIDLTAETWYDLRNDETVRLYTDDEGIERPRRIVSPAAGISEISHAWMNNRLGTLAASNPLAQQILQLPLRVPEYRGPKHPVTAVRLPSGDWDYTWDDPPTP